MILGSFHLQGGDGDEIRPSKHTCSVNHYVIDITTHELEFKTLNSVQLLGFIWNNPSLNVNYLFPSPDFFTPPDLFCVFNCSDLNQIELCSLYKCPLYTDGIYRLKVTTTLTCTQTSKVGVYNIADKKNARKEKKNEESRKDWKNSDNCDPINSG